LQDQAQDAMGSGVRRTEIEEHEIGCPARTRHPPLFGTKLERLFFGFLFLLGQMETPHFRGAGGMILPERMADPGRRHQDSPQMRMALEGDAEHVPDFALIPARGRP
jgi:hypothetical protein